MQNKEKLQKQCKDLALNTFKDFLIKICEKIEKMKLEENTELAIKGATFEQIASYFIGYSLSILHNFCEGEELEKMQDELLKSIMKKAIDHSEHHIEYCKKVSDEFH